MKTKNDVEKLLGEALYLLGVQRFALTLWQQSCFIDALYELKHGAYPAAWNLGLDVMARNVAEDPFKDNGATAKRLAGATLEHLKRDLHPHISP